MQPKKLKEIKNSNISSLCSQEKIQGRLDFLKKERQELLEFKVNDDKKTQELLVRAMRCSGVGRSRVLSGMRGGG